MTMMAMQQMGQQSPQTPSLPNVGPHITGGAFQGAPPSPVAVISSTSGMQGRMQVMMKRRMQGFPPQLAGQFPQFPSTKGSQPASPPQTGPASQFPSASQSYQAPPTSGQSYPAPPSSSQSYPAPPSSGPSWPLPPAGGPPPNQGSARCPVTVYTSISKWTGSCNDDYVPTIVSVWPSVRWSSVYAKRPNARSTSKWANA